MKKVDPEVLKKSLEFKTGLLEQLRGIQEAGQLSDKHIIAKVETANPMFLYSLVEERRKSKTSNDLNKIEVKPEVKPEEKK